MTEPLYKNRDHKSCRICQFPLNAYSSFVYNFVGFYFYNIFPIISFSLFILGIVSFFWWSYQRYKIQCIDLGIITYLYGWCLINYLELNSFQEFVILHSCILSIFVFNKVYLKSLHILLIFLSVVVLIKTFNILPIFLFILAGYCKFNIDYIGTMLFHIISAFTIFVLLYNL